MEPYRMNAGRALLVNSMPKSGTFLLKKVVELLGFRHFAQPQSTLGRMWHERGFGMPIDLNHESVRSRLAYRLQRRSAPSERVPIGVTSPIEIPAKLFHRWMGSLPPGSYILGHVPWSPAARHVLGELGMKHILIIRDPRDVYVSFLHYVVRPAHELSESFGSMSPEERAAVVLDGGFAGPSGRRIAGVSETLRSIAQWRPSAECLIVKFENLVGEKGGGSREAQIGECLRITGHLGIEIERESLPQLCDQFFDTSSPTFRKGRAGAWRDEIPPAVLERLNDLSRDFLREFGYEQ
jgi:hypothetical protein